MRYIPSTYNVIKYKARIPVSLDLFKTVTSAATFARESSGFFCDHLRLPIGPSTPNLTTTSIKTITTSRTFPAKLVFSLDLFLKNHLELYQMLWYTLTCNFIFSCTFLQLIFIQRKHVMFGGNAMTFISPCYNTANFLATITHVLSFVPFIAFTAVTIFLIMYCKSQRQTRNVPDC